MTSDRDRLIGLLKETFDYTRGVCMDFDEAVEINADYLLANGVIILPCKIWSTVYTVERYCNTDPYENTKEIVKPWHCEECCGRRDCSFSEFRVEPHIVGSAESALNIGRSLGTYYFSTREEAEKSLKEKQK